jgi:hypothetical protein
VILGVATITAFLFLGSEDTIDAPRLSGPGAGQGRGGGAAEIPVVRIEGGAPPPSGPARLGFEQGERVRFRVLTDAPTTIAVLGYGIERQVSSGERVSFRARRPGQFPVVVADSRIGIASVTITPR